MVRCPNCMKEYNERYDVCPYCGFVKGTPPKEAYHLYPGTVLRDRYLIGTVLGFGGFGITYRAWDTRLEREVAIKEFYPGGIVNRIPGEKTVIVYTGKREMEFAKGRERFLTEARNMAKYNQHPNIVHVFEFFAENNTAYIVMEFLDGVSYGKYIANQGGKVNQDIAVSVATCIAKALADIHKTHIVHRDVSPDNIFICRNGVIKLIDFGAARFSSGEEEKTLSIILKPGYAPPEQYRSKSRQGPWTDVYALGAVLYRSLTGVMPDESVNRAVEDRLKAPMELDTSIPQYLSDSIMRALALNPELRFQNMDQFIKAIQNQKKVRPLEKEIAKRKCIRWLSMGGIGLILCGGIAACIMVYRDKRQDVYGLEAELEFWIPENETSAKEIYQQAIKKFNQYYPNVRIEIQEIPEDTYWKNLKSSEVFPDIFDSTELGMADLSEKAGTLEELGNQINPKQYYFLGDLMEDNSELYQIPLGFAYPVLYVNIGMDESGDSGSRKEHVKKWIEEGNFSIKEENKDLYSGFLSRNSEGKKPEEFYTQESPVLLGTSEDYAKVQEEMTGLYELIWPEDVKQETEDLKIRFLNAISVSGQLSQSQQEGAEAFINYLLSEPGQDILNVRGGMALPLNRNMYREYVTINGELDRGDAVINGMDFLKQ